MLINNDKNKKEEQFNFEGPFKKHVTLLGDGGGVGQFHEMPDGEGGSKKG